MAEGESLREICRTKGYPAESTVRLWAVTDRDGFAAFYARAREAQVDRWAEEIVEIADDASNDWMERKNGDGTTSKVPDQENINRSRLRVDTRKWLMSKIAPKKYGEKITQEHTGPLVISWQKDEAANPPPPQRVINGPPPSNPSHVIVLDTVRKLPANPPEGDAYA